jgi:hypothetical protein
MCGKRCESAKRFVATSASTVLAGDSAHGGGRITARVLKSTNTVGDVEKYDKAEKCPRTDRVFAGIADIKKLLKVRS